MAEFEHAGGQTPPTTFSCNVFVASSIRVWHAQQQIRIPFQIFQNMPFWESRIFFVLEIVLLLQRMEFSFVAQGNFNFWLKLNSLRQQKGMSIDWNYWLNQSIDIPSATASTNEAPWFLKQEGARKARTALISQDSSCSRSTAYEPTYRPAVWCVSHVPVRRSARAPFRESHAWLLWNCDMLSAPSEFYALFVKQWKAPTTACVSH